MIVPNHIALTYFFKVPSKFRYPFYGTIHWYMLHKYYKELKHVGVKPSSEGENPINDVILIHSSPISDTSNCQTSKNARWLKEVSVEKMSMASLDNLSSDEYSSDIASPDTTSTVHTSTPPHSYQSHMCSTPSHLHQPHISATETEGLLTLVQRMKDDELFHLDAPPSLAISSTDLLTWLASQLRSPLLTQLCSIQPTGASLLHIGERSGSKRKRKGQHSELPSEKQPKHSSLTTTLPSKEERLVSSLTTSREIENKDDVFDCDSLKRSPEPESPVERSPKPESPVERPPEPESPVERPPEPGSPVERPPELESPVERPPEPGSPVERPPELESPVERPPELESPVDSKLIRVSLSCLASPLGDGTFNFNDESPLRNPPGTDVKTPPLAATSPFSLQLPPSSSQPHSTLSTPSQPNSIRSTPSQPHNIPSTPSQHHSTPSTPSQTHSTLSTPPPSLVEIVYSPSVWGQSKLAPFQDAPQLVLSPLPLSCTDTEHSIVKLINPGADPSNQRLNTASLN